MICPCGSSKDYEACCAPYHRGEQDPPSAEALMRARYAAFACGEVDFVWETLAPERREDGEKEDIARWSRESEWLDLIIRKTEAGTAADSHGTVEFVARYKQHGEEQMHHELASFEKREGRWLFVDGQTPEATTVLREGPKIGRNDACPCASGKKYKRCCGA